MKRLVLTIFFTVYTIFVPFFVASCSSVADHQFEPLANLSPESQQELLDRCQAMEVLIKECVDVLQAEEDRKSTEEGVVTSARLDLVDFLSCQEPSASQAGDDSSSLADGCSGAIEGFVAAYEVCDGLETSEKYPDCSTIEREVNDALDLCDQGDASISEAFCLLLTA